MQDEKLLCSYDEARCVTEALNGLIREAVSTGGHVYLTDKRHNDFIIRLTDDVNIKFCGVRRTENES